MIKWVLFFLIPVGLLAQSKNWISGFIYDASSGEALIGATIYLPKSKQGSISDNYGKYNLALPLDQTVQVQVSYVGYQAIDTLLQISGSQSLDFRLSLQSLGEVVVVAKAGNLQHNVLQIPVERLKAVPMLMGQPDLIKALAFFPGVTTGVEGTTGLYVRGGTPDQNLILLDGATVYNASHLFGFQSVFDPSAIKDIKLYKGGFPARYGGRLSSIIDITMKDGNNQTPHGEFTLGLINSGVMVEGPIKKSTSSYMVSARAAYLGLLLLPTALSWKKKDDQPFNTLLSNDFNFKINHQFKNQNKLYASAYFGNDFLLTRFRYDSSFYRNQVGWGNQTASLRYLHHFGKKLYGQTLLTYNRFFSKEENKREEIGTDVKGAFLRQSLLRDYALKQFFYYSFNPQLKINAGLEVINHFFRPSNAYLDEGNGLNLDSTFAQNQTYRPWTLAYFAEGNWRPRQWLTFEAGLRRSVYQTAKNNRGFWEPRLNIQSNFGAFSANVAYALTSQFVHLLSNNSIGLSSDLWVPSTNKIAPQWAEQYSAGLLYRAPNRKWELGLEAYQKYLYQQIDYRQGLDFFDLENLNWENTVESGGIGKSVGVEVMLKRETESFNAWIAYTWSNTQRRFDNINRGEWYPFRYDKRDNLNVNFLKKLKNNWSMGLNFVYQTGTWITMESARYLGGAGSLSLNRSGAFNLNMIDFVSGRNNQRLPDYHRADISFNKHYSAKKGKGSSMLNVSVYNLYGRENPFIINSTTSESFINGERRVFQTYETKALFTFIPAVSYTKKW